MDANSSALLSLFGMVLVGPISCLYEIVNGLPLQGQVTTVALSFLRNFGISGTSGVLSALSAGVGSLAGDQKGDKERQKARNDREISGLGAGLVEGGSSLASGFRRGFTGLVSKPLQGASQSGVTGQHVHTPSKMLAS